jgi:hypothetical protein
MIEMIAIVAFSVLFLHTITTEGMILQIVSVSLIGLPTWLKKPLYSCSTCMCMWWGPAIVAIGILFLNWQITSWIQVIIICVSAGGMNAAVGKVSGAIKPCDCERKKRLKLI